MNPFAQSDFFCCQGRYQTWSHAHVPQAVVWVQAAPLCVRGCEVVKVLTNGFPRSPSKPFHLLARCHNYRAHCNTAGELGVRGTSSAGI